jgi:hypothetical protein
MKGEHADLVILSAVADHFAATGEENEVVGAVPLFDDVQTLVDLPAECLAVKVLAQEDGLDGPAELRERLVDQLRADDVVIVSRLDRLARSTRDLLDIAEQLKEAEAGLRSLHEPWADTTSPAGRMVLTVFAGIAEFERELIHERTGAGRVSAKARGVRFGRPPKLTADQIALARRLLAEGTSVPEASRILKVHRSTLYRALEM